MKVYRIFVDGKNGTMLFKNSLVKSPAHGKVKMAFDKQVVAIEFDDAKQNIVGVAIAPEVKIFRTHPQLGNHFVVFGKDDIATMAYLYGKKNSWNKLTFNHSDAQPVKSATMYMSYIIDRKNGMTPPKAFKDESDGAWLLGYHFADKAEYEFARDNFTGWSVEGEFYLEEVNQKQINMSKTKKAGFFASMLALIKSAFGSVTTTDGTVVSYEGDELAVGTAVFVNDADGNPSPAPDGSHTLEDGRTIVVAAGLVESIEEKSEEEEMEAEVSVEDMQKFAEVIVALSKRIEKLEKTPTVKPEQKKFERTEMNSVVDHLLRNTKKS